jgi:hypothetical protein
MRYACLARPTSTTAGLACFGTTFHAKVAFKAPTLVALAIKVPILEGSPAKKSPTLEALAPKFLGFGDEVIKLLFKVEVVDLRMRDEA